MKLNSTTLHMFLYQENTNHPNSIANINNKHNDNHNPNANPSVNPNDNPNLNDLFINKSQVIAISVLSLWWHGFVHKSPVLKWQLFILITMLVPTLQCLPYSYGLRHNYLHLYRHIHFLFLFIKVLCAFQLENISLSFSWYMHWSNM